MDDFEKIYNDYNHRITAFLYKLCRDSQLCEELTQESFYQAFKSFHKYKNNCDIFTWLAAVAKNTYYRHLRKNKHKILSLDILDTEPYRDLYSQPEGKVIEAEQHELLRKSIDSLPEKYRDVAVLRTYAELPFSQIACILNINENSAKVIFYRAKNMIRGDIGYDD